MKVLQCPPNNTSGHPAGFILSCAGTEGGGCLMGFFTGRTEPEEMELRLPMIYGWNKLCHGYAA
jgi:hypothetical protein